VIPARYWSWLGERQTLVTLLWTIALASAGISLWHAFAWANNSPSEPEDRQRTDGNGGHTQIDFGGQWLMGRMVVHGHGRELYHRQRQWEVAWESYPVDDEPPLVAREALARAAERRSGKPDDALQHDAERLMGWFMGKDPPEWRAAGGAVAAPFAAAPDGNPFFAIALQDGSQRAAESVQEKLTAPAIGGPLYPPVQALFYAPLGLIDRPLVAYHVFQVVLMGSVFLAGLGISILTRGRIWWSVASLLVMAYPGTRGGLDLGQNPTITFCIVVWGWALASRGKNVAGGMVWGLLAFKPVWALALLIVPLFSGRWRFFFAMGITGTALAALTLPIVGVESWFDWLKVGDEASELYKVNRNWIHLSRDLQGIPRRMLHDFELPESKRETVLASRLAWATWGTVFALTTFIYLVFGGRKKPTGMSACFLYLGAFLTCYHFMYYDMLLSLLGFVLLLPDPRQLLVSSVFGFSPGTRCHALNPDRSLDSPPPDSGRFRSRYLGYVNSLSLTLLAFMLIHENVFTGMDLQATMGFGYYARPTSAPNGETGLHVPKIVADTTADYPAGTFIILTLWAWCGVRLLLGAGHEEVSQEEVPTLPFVQSSQDKG
jgi:hypothetical protein